MNCMWRNVCVICSRSLIIHFTFVLNASKTEVALPVQLIKIRPKHLVGCAKPKRASTFAPAPSPKPITYLTCKKSSTVTKSSPSIWNEGYWKLHKRKYSLITLCTYVCVYVCVYIQKQTTNKSFVCLDTYESGKVSALSACPGASTWIKHERSLISVIQGLLTKSWNDESDKIKMKNYYFSPKNVLYHD